MLKKYRFALTYLAFLFLCLLGFSFLFSTPYFYDDHEIIERNLLLHSFSSIPDMFRGQVSSIGEMNGVYRPMMMTWLTIIGKIFGHSLVAYRFSSMALHALNATLLFYVCVEIISLSSIVSFLVGAVFLLHPLQTMNLAMVWKQSDVWIAFFALLSILLWQKPKTPTWVFPILFLTALLFKESAIVLPLLWLALFAIKPSEKWRGLAALFCLIVGIFYVRGYGAYLPHSVVQTVSNPYSGFHYFLTQLHVVPLYLAALLVPTSSTIDRIIPITLSIGTYEIVMMLLLAVLVFFAFASLRKKNIVGFLILAMLFWLTPTSSFHPLSLLYDETRMYLVVGLLAAMFFYVLEPFYIRLSSKARYGIGVFLVIALVGCNRLLAPNWKSERALWENATTVDSCAARAYYQIGLADEADRAFDDAQANYEKAIRCSDFLPQANVHLGIVLGKKGDLSGAQKAFESLLKAPPYWSAQANYHLGLTSLYQNNADQAEKFFLTSHAQSPEQKLCEKGMSLLRKTNVTDCTNLPIP